MRPATPTRSTARIITLLTLATTLALAPLTAAQAAEPDPGGAVLTASEVGKADAGAKTAKASKDDDKSKSKDDKSKDDDKKAKDDKKSKDDDKSKDDATSKDDSLAKADATSKADAASKAKAKDDSLAKAKDDDKKAKDDATSKGTGDGVAAAKGDKTAKCTTYDFVYTDGHRDTGEFCGKGNNLTRANTSGLHAALLHISCSDTFSTVVTDGTGAFIGWTTDGKSDLAGHVIAAWQIVKDRGSPCGPGVPPPPPPPPCTGPLTIQVRHADTGVIVTGTATATIAGTSRTLDSDGITAGGTFACDTPVTGTLTTPPSTWTTVDGTDSTTVTSTGGLLIFTVRKPGTPPPCTGPLTIQVRDADTGAIVTGTATATIAGTSRTLDSDGITAGGTFACDTPVTGTLTTPPSTWTTVDGTDSTTVTSTGGLLVFTVRKPGTPPPCTGPLTIQVRDADTGAIVTGTATATIAGTSRTLDSDGSTFGGTFACNTPVTGTLTTPPSGWNTVDGTDDTVVTTTGGILIFTVRQPGTPPPPPEDCLGALVVEVVDEAGERVDGASVVVGTQGLTVEDGIFFFPTYACGDVEGEIVEAPSGYAIVPPSIDRTTVVDGETAELRFVVGVTEVLGITIDREPDPPTAPAPDPEPAPAPAPAPAVAADDLARTGADARGSAALAAALLLLGTVMLQVGRSRNGGHATSV